MSHNNDRFPLYIDGHYERRTREMMAEKAAKNYDHKIGDIPAEYEMPRSGLPVPSVAAMEVIPGYRPKN